MTGSKSIIVKDHIRASLMKHRSDSIFSVTDSQVMIHCESSLLRHSLCSTFSLYLSHFWEHITLYAALSLNTCLTFEGISLFLSSPIYWIRSSPNAQLVFVILLTLFVETANKDFTGPFISFCPSKDLCCGFF